MLSLMIEKSLDTFDFDLVEKLVTLERAVSKWEERENTLSTSIDKAPTLISDLTLSLLSPLNDFFEEY